MKKCCLLIPCILACTLVFGQWLRADGRRVVNQQGDEVILRGMGLGGWMLQEPYMLQLSGAAIAQHDIRKKINELAGDEITGKFYEAWLQNHCTKADIDSLAAWGFNSVRLPMHFNLFTLPIDKEPVAGKNTWLQKGFALTDSLLSWCSANRIYLILDLHAAPGGQGNDHAISDRDTSQPSLWQAELNRQKTIALWQQLASRYANQPWIGGYDIINEPNWGFENLSDKNGCAEKSNAPLKRLMKDITAAIRSVDKKHIIIIEGNCWGNNYENILPQWDANMMLSFHKYWNYTDLASIEKFINYREQYNLPIWMGESGENSNTWFTNTIQLLEKNKIGWAWWPLKKSGINNPLEVKINPGYQQIIDYWRGKGPKPSAANAANALMQLAKDVHISQNIIHYDVIDAMMQQSHTPKVKPYKDHQLDNSLTIFATDYDLGRINESFSDADDGNYWVSNNQRTEWNKGWKYRNDGVDIESCTDSLSNGYAVGWTEDGEWMQYTINVAKSGVYQVHLRYAAREVNGKMQLMVNGKTSEAFQLAATGSYANWKNSALLPVRLDKGVNTIRIMIQKGGFNLNYLQFNFQNSTANTDYR